MKVASALLMVVPEGIHIKAYTNKLICTFVASNLQASPSAVCVFPKDINARLLYNWLLTHVQIIASP